MIATIALGLLAVAKLIWSDEFTGAAGTKPDPAKWTYDLGAKGWGNAELENYTTDPANASLDGEGHLVIRAIRHQDGSYTSARLKTQGRFAFTYGRVEARMKIAHGQGIWPAFWMLGNNIRQVGWPTCGEIDIMENIGKEPAIVHGTVHGPGYSGSHGITSQISLPGAPVLSSEFHVYSADWSPGKIVFAVDDLPYATVTPASLPAGAKWVYDHPFFLLLNLAVGGKWPGNPDQSSQFPQELVVDWVRVTQR